MLRENKTTPILMSQLNVELGVMFGEAVEGFNNKHNVGMSDIDLIGFYGQTIRLLSMPDSGKTRPAFYFGEESSVPSQA